MICNKYSLIEDKVQPSIKPLSLKNNIYLNKIIQSRICEIPTDTIVG
jgi:hypothetical protein